MMGFNIFLPNGHTHVIKYEQGQDKNAIANALVEEWAEYCEKNWLSVNHNDHFCPENKVKRFFDSLTYFLLYCDAQDIITNYKEKRNAESEVLIPDNHDGLVIGIPIEVIQAVDTAPSAFLGKKHITKKDTPIETAFDRIEKLEKENPSLKISVCTVDTTGNFEYAHTKWSISKDVPQYRARETKSGARYDMDRILCGVCDDGQVIFLDQYGTRLNNNFVKDRNDSIDDSKTDCSA